MSITKERLIERREQLQNIVTESAAKYNSAVAQLGEINVLIDIIETQVSPTKALAKPAKKKSKAKLAPVVLEGKKA